MPEPETPNEVQQWLLDQLRQLWPLALGCLSLRRSPCIRKHCPACESGEQHRSYVLYGKLGGRRFTVYVPDDLAPELESAIANGRQVQELLYEAGKRYAEAIKRRRTSRRLEDLAVDRQTALE